MGNADSKKIFKDFLLSQGLKSTNQRELILEEFLRAGSHLSTEELYLRLRKQHPRIGYATVHRSLKLFAQCGIAEQRHFGDGQARYEASDHDEHHDHWPHNVPGHLQNDAVQQCRIEQTVSGCDERLHNRYEGASCANADKALPSKDAIRHEETLRE